MSMRIPMMYRPAASGEHPANRNTVSLPDGPKKFRFRYGNGERDLHRQRAFGAGCSVQSADCLFNRCKCASRPQLTPRGYSQSMFGKMINMPFKLLGGVARVVQAQEAKKWTSLAKRDATAALDNQSMDISVPDDFDPGSIVLAASDAVQLRSTGCILDTAAHATIHGALHIPMKDIGIGIAEVPADVRVAVIAEHTEDAHRVVRFLRHRGLDDTWVVDGGLAAWRAVDHPVHQE